MRRFFVFLLSLFLVLELSAQSVPVVGNDRNWVSGISYDLSGAVVGKSVSYFNVLGKATQHQSYDILTGRVWASEVRYDSFGRPVLSTLSAPVNATGIFDYRSDFIRSGGSSIGLLQYDSSSTLENPPVLSAEPSTLGWYYSGLNTLDPYQDLTLYPYTRTIFSDLNPGAVKKVLGGNKIGNQWLQSYSFTMVAEKPVNSILFYRFYDGKKVMKTVSRDVHGVESVVYTDTDGNVLGAARSGANLEGALDNKLVYVPILDKGYVDIHSCSSVSIKGYDANKHQIKIYDLITEQEFTTFTIDPSTGMVVLSGNAVLPSGFYRIVDVNNYYGTHTDDLTINPLRVEHFVSYYDLSYNEYDLADRLLKTVQPVSDTQFSSFQYNSLGQLLSSYSVDEGSSSFLYRKDGQIRFSQNTEQKKRREFSFTNYDDLGRPVSSGVYRGATFYSFDGFNTDALQLSTLVDIPDGIEPTGKQELNYSFYDTADPSLTTKLQTCGIPSPQYKQTFLSGNVSYTYTENPRTNQSWYSYDAYGRVTWMIQEPEGLGCLKTIDYEYDPYNGSLLMVDYQRYNAAERFIHYYEYNLAGQLKKVYTSLDGKLKTLQAHYIYNESGALIRTELAENLQGIDYVYNLNGQLKAINHPSLLPTNDPGNDGTNGFAADVFGMQLDYYAGDYTRFNSPKPIGTLTEGGTDQYNGNIKAMRWNTQVPSATQQAYSYEYNKNNWLKSATFGAATNGSSFGFAINAMSMTPHTNNDYKVSGITYDANGNITRLNRKGYTDANGSNSMDNFRYVYDKDKKNRLSFIEDNQDNTDVNRYNDLKNQALSTFTTADAPIQNQNYVYNDLGQLLTDIQAGVAYEYNASGLVTKINSFTTTPNAEEDMKTLYFKNYEVPKNYSLAISNLDSGFKAITPAPPGVGIEWGRLRAVIPDCELSPDGIMPLHEAYGNEVFLQALGSATFQSRLKVTPNTYTTFDLDLLISRNLYVSSHVTIDPTNGIGDPNLISPPDDGTGTGGTTGTTPTDDGGDPVYINSIGEPISPTVVVTLKRPDGSVIATQTFSNLSTATPVFCGRFVPKHVSFAYTTGTESHVIVEITPSHNLTESEVPPGQFQQIFIDNVHLRGATQTKVAFFYNDRGHRIKKVSYHFQTTETTTYVCDASGSVMAIHQQEMNPLIRTRPIARIEHPVYGASRIGIYKREGKTGYTLYELTDHLGNVRAVIRKTPTGLLSLTSKTDYYPFGMPMPNRFTTDANYRYAFQGQEKDNETGMEAFELRLWDGRIGRWLTVDPAGEFQSPYLGMGNNPINAIDPDGGDIIFLNDSKSVGGLGHAAVLIGNDKDGWRYLSMNGTGTGEHKGSAYGKSITPDLGDKKGQNDFRGTGLKLSDVMKLVNKSNKDHHHNYNRAIRIRTTTAEDKIAYAAAKKQASTDMYGICGASCIDVPQEAFASVLAKRAGQKSLTLVQENIYGFDETIPNLWYTTFDANMFIINFDIITNRFLNIINPSTETFEYYEVSLSPRYN